MLIGGIILPQSDFYVSAEGNDSNRGALNSPWATIEKVNAHSFAPGDRVFFRGGDVFPGNILIEPEDQPTELSPLLITSYGTGMATILGGDGFCIKAVNCGWITVSNIKAVGTAVSLTGTFPNQTASTTSPFGGLIFMEAGTADIFYRGVRVENCETSGGFSSIMFLSTNSSATSAYDSPVVEGNVLKDAAGFGIIMVGYNGSVRGQGGIFKSPTISQNRIESVSGLSNVPVDGGMCLAMFNASDALIEGNLLKKNGWAATGNPVSLLLVETSAPVVRSNEVSSFYTGGGDGHGIDCDIQCVGAVVEKNFVHDPGAPNLSAFFNFTGTNNVFRQNIVQGGSAFFGNGGSATLYQNTFYNNSSRATIISTGCVQKLYNNIISSPGNVALVSGLTSSGGGCIGNLYYVIGAGAFIVITDASVTLSSISEMRAAGFEVMSAVNYGASGLAFFAQPGAGVQQLMSSPVSSLSAYDLGFTSAAAGIAVALSEVSIIAPVSDWHGNSIDSLNRDAGAVPLGST